MEEKIEELKQSLLNNMPTLFLGAGFSRGAICESGVMPTGNELKSELFNSFLKEWGNDKDKQQIINYDLRELCDCIDAFIKDGKKKREQFLTERLRGAVPNENGYHRLLLKYPWKRIYTVNIDDLVENIYEGAHKQYKSFYSAKVVPEHGEETTLIKLHGCVRNEQEGYIFSKKEYSTLINQTLDLRLIDFTNELYSSNDIVFVGASMDEPDLDYYLQMYENMQIISKKSKIFFIEPSPTPLLKQWEVQLGATIIEWNTEQFLKFAAGLDYNPQKKDYAILNLNRHMIYRLRDDIKLFKEHYDSDIYQGFSCKWQDVFEHWTFQHSVYINAKGELEKLLEEKNKTKCFCIYGASFAGKSTLLKQLGYWLFSNDYEVLECVGNDIEQDVITNYIYDSNFRKYAIIIDNAAFYYPVIERILKKNFYPKEVIVICASRIHYHNKKKYYLRGNCLLEFNCNDLIKFSDAEKIYPVLNSKNALGYLYDLSDERQRLIEITRKRTVINLLFDLTYGNGMRKRFQKEIRVIKRLSYIEEKLLIEVAVFNQADIEYYPIALFVEKYGKMVSLSRPKSWNIDELKISDYVKYDDPGISLRNTPLQSEIIKFHKSELYPVIEELLQRISPRVHEGKRDIWTIIFQSLCNQQRLKDVFYFSDNQQDALFRSLNDKYDNISYYWLQRGLFEQSKGDYAKAYLHLKKSQSIHPNSFKIQHAIARNYLKFANSQRDYSLAEPLFSKGEILMKQLIYSNEYYIEKAKPYSVDTYVLEKVEYIGRFGLDVTNEELREMCRMLDSVYTDGDTYILGAMRKFYYLLQRKDKLSILRMNLKNPYLEMMKEDLYGQEDMAADFY